MLKHLKNTLMPKQMGNIKYKKKDMIGSGTIKKAYAVDIISGLSKPSNEVVLIESPYTGTSQYPLSKEDVEKILDNQRKANKHNYAPEIYATNLKDNKFSFLTEKVKGKQICDLLPLEIDHQKELLTCYLTLGIKERIYQGDENCENIYFDGKKLSIIDDITDIDDNEYDKGESTELQTIAYFVLDELCRFAYIQELPLKTFLYNWLIENKSFRKDHVQYTIDTDTPESLPDLKDEEKKNFQSIVDDSLKTQGGKRKTRKQKKSLKRKFSKARKSSKKRK